LKAGLLSASQDADFPSGNPPKRGAGLPSSYAFFSFSGSRTFLFLFFPQPFRRSLPDGGSLPHRHPSRNFSFWKGEPRPSIDGGLGLSPRVQSSPFFGLFSVFFHVLPLTPRGWSRPSVDDSQDLQTLPFPSFPIVSSLRRIFPPSSSPATPFPIGDFSSRGLPRLLIEGR